MARGGPSRGFRGALLLLVCLGLVTAVQADDYSRAKQELQAALDQGGPRTISLAVEKIAATGDARAVRLIIFVGERHRDDPVRSAVRVALASQEDLDWIDALTESLRDAKGDAPAILAIEAFGSIENPAVAESLVLAMETVRPNILVAALRMARKRTDRELIPACIDVLARSEAEAGLVWAEATITLQTLTGEKLRIAEDWKKWYETRPDDWIPRAARGAEEKSKTAVYRPEGDGGIGLPRVFGQEIPSKRVVFVIDTSQSMAKVDPTEREEGSAGGQGPTRLQRAQKELIAAIDALRPDVRFNIIAYSTLVRVWSPDRLVKAKKGAKRKAIAFVGAMKPVGHTNTGEAMLTAMSLPDVNTIILISDGSPTIPGVGKLAEIPPILEMILETNRFLNITMHTLGFDGAKISFMKAIANGTGGTYAAVK